MYEASSYGPIKGWDAIHVVGDFIQILLSASHVSNIIAQSVIFNLISGICPIKEWGISGAI